jgi:hypothetical protein
MQPGNPCSLRTWATPRRGRGLHNNKSLPCGGDDLGSQLHPALQQFYVQPLHQLFLGLILLGLKSHEAQVELIVVTLALGPRPRQGSHKVAGQEGDLGVTSHVPESAKSVKE